MLDLIKSATDFFWVKEVPRSPNKWNELPQDVATGDESKEEWKSIFQELTPGQPQMHFHSDADFLRLSGNTATRDLSKYVYFKAEQAFRTHNKPVLVEVLSWSFPAFKGFPGTEYDVVLQQIGLEGILALVEAYNRRTTLLDLPLPLSSANAIYLTCAIGYVAGNCVKIAEATRGGYVGKHIRPHTTPTFDCIFVPNRGLDNVLDEEGESSASAAYSLRKDLLCQLLQGRGIYYHDYSIDRAFT